MVALYNLPCGLVLQDASNLLIVFLVCETRQYSLVIRERATIPVKSRQLCPTHYEIETDSDNTLFCHIFNKADCLLPLARLILFYKHFMKSNNTDGGSTTFG